MRTKHALFFKEVRMATVKLENIYKSFDETEVLFDINLEIKDKEFVVFVGAVVSFYL